MDIAEGSPPSLSVSPPNAVGADVLLSLPQASRKLKRIREMKMPYGQELFDKVVETYVPLFDPLSDISPSHKTFLLKSIEKTFFLFEKCSRWSRLRWVEQHLRIRVIMLKIIASNSRISFYIMGEAEIEQWINQVFISIKKEAGSLFRLQSQPSPQRELQIVVNALYQLITLMNAEACKQEIFHQYYSYLVYLCQRTCLAPSTYLLNPADVAIDHSDSLGCGATSDIYRCTVDGIEAVAKTYRVFKGINKRDTRHFLKEALLLRLIIPHPHILPSLGVIMSPNALQIISPWMRNGSIVKYTKKHPNVSKKELLEQVADGLHFLHQYNIVHGDLKGDNILITDDGKACIADLGASNFMELSQPLKASSSRPIVAFQSFVADETIRSESTATNDSAISSLSGMSVFSAAGTTRYMAPERLFPEKHGAESARATPPSDVFSFGMLAWEVYSGEVPFSEIRVPAYAAQKILRGQRPPKPRTMTSDLWRLVESCWKKSPHTRPTIHSIYNELATMP